VNATADRAVMRKKGEEGELGQSASTNPIGGRKPRHMQSPTPQTRGVWSGRAVKPGNVDAKPFGVHKPGNGSCLLHPGGLAGRRWSKLKRAPMFAKGKGRTLDEYSPGRSSRSPRWREEPAWSGKAVGEKCGPYAGKMLMGKPGANRLQDTADVNWTHW